ncbi:MAG TPA: MarR family transcriptional regulator [Bryobacteraceae bacterium]|nr:MarR family transcriptional regulator [Bryobacteraceae bacterium]
MNAAQEEAKNRFLQSWGDMGPKWGIPKAMAQIHALLMITETPLSTDDVMQELGISRGNANTNLRSLADWGLVRRVFKKGDRKEYFQADKDVWNMFCRIARERKKREIEPVIDTLRECLDLVGNEKGSALFRERVSQLLDLVKTLDYVLGKIAQQEKNTIIPRILKLVG